MQSELSYIPTEEQRIRIYQKISQGHEEGKKVRKNQPTIKNGKENQIDFSNLESKGNKNNRILSQAELTQLLSRLTQDTKRDFMIQQQILKLHQVNTDQATKRREGQKVEQRLLGMGKKLQQKRQKLILQHQEKIKKTLREKPAVSRRAHSIHQKPIYQRLNRVIQQRNILSNELASKYQPAFQPKIDPYSDFVGEIHRQNEGDFLARVEKYQAIKQKRLQEKTKQLMKLQMKDVTFQPFINLSNKVSQHQTDRRLYSNKTLNEYLEQEENTFQPKINKRSQKLVKDKEIQQEPTCYERLYQRSEEIKEKIDRKREIEKQRYNHIPKINQRSKAIIQQKLKPKAEVQIETLDRDYQQVILGWNGQELFDQKEDHQLHSHINLTKGNSTQKQNPKVNNYLQKYRQKDSRISRLL